eukprot:EG_transcript_1212
MAFAEVNAAGGVQGRNLTLLAMDDGYDPTVSVENFQTLKNQSLLLAGLYGTAANIALLPLILQTDIPSVAPWTGSSVTRFPFNEQSINVRASYADEMVVHAIMMVQQLRVHRIACFYQNDSFGLSVLGSLDAALNYVGLQLAVTAAYNTTSVDVDSALETIAGYPQRVQAVVMASLEDANVKFLHGFLQDSRTDPDCVFLIISVGVTSNFSTKLDSKYWPNLYFTQTVPPLDTPGLGLISQFQAAASLYMPPGVIAGPLSLEGYLVGRLIARVLLGIPGEITRKAFLDELYNTRLYDFGGLLVGMYSRNFSGCDKIVCGSSIGLRYVFPATLNPSTGAMHYNATLGAYFSYSVTELSFPLTEIVRPLLFGQLVPTDDPGWRQVAEAIGQGLQNAFALLNAAGGVNGRPVELIQWYYSGDPAPHAAALADRYALLAFVGSVVNQSSSLSAYAASQIGTYQTDPPATYAAYNYTEVQVQASLPLELMALAAFACKLGQPVHLRAPNTSAGQVALQAMVQSLNSLQQQPASSLTFASAAEALQGLSGLGTVIAVGSDADVAAWFSALAGLPQLRLLVPSQRVVHLLASLNVLDFPQANRLHYPNMFGAGVTAATAGPEVQGAALYGQLLGGLLRTVLARAGNASLAYTTTAQLLGALYGSQYKLNGVTLGPYYSACSTASTDCDCNDGVRQLTVLTALRQAQPVQFSYSIATCHVVYAALLIPPAAGLWYIGVIVGVVVGIVVLAAVGWRLSRHGRRDNAAAPKSSAEPFCIVFTDIQSSTHMWSAVPDVMVRALQVHHLLIRRLIVKHGLYEVKTIGDSFMCASRSPLRAVEFALQLQRQLYEHDWGTTAIDDEYVLQQEALSGPWTASHAGWNGLRVRVGVHYGQGEVYLDPVSKGYDYYGTVVNTAARVEAVCHGGQIGITQAVHDAMNGEFPGAVMSDLGEQVLRGLLEPVHLYQLVPWELAKRTFPPLRLEYAAAVEVAVCPPANLDSQLPPHPSTSSRSRVVPVAGSTSSGRKSTSTSRTAAVGAPAWVESHPLVLRGQLAEEDLAVRYCTVQKSLATLLETQTQRVRESSLRAFCERLHVRYFGCEGTCLDDTLHGVVQRVLPAALSAVPSAHAGRAAMAPN